MGGQFLCLLMKDKNVLYILCKQISEYHQLMFHCITECFRLKFRRKSLFWVPQRDAPYTMGLNENVALAI